MDALRADRHEVLPRAVMVARQLDEDPADTILIPPGKFSKQVACSDWKNGNKMGKCRLFLEKCMAKLEKYVKIWQKLEKYVFAIFKS